uniref:oligosaccharide flippase family protein n=1 Tax=uncultured Polaribacter sp. TaxID=174711 RepID=UPI00262DE8A3|nr:polysaccharide biosynthesis C-terminal domain-containing protein [uncultured Polaribacter sp.]
MNIIIEYIKGFLNRSGSYVFLATILGRVLSFIASWIALEFIENDALGVVLFAYNIILFVIPISGFGLHQSLIRYGALAKSSEDKDYILAYVFKKGMVACLVLITIVISISLFINFKFENTLFYVVLLSFTIIPSYLLEIIRAQFRLQHNNKSFAFTEGVQSIILLLSVLVLSYSYKELGYAIALLLTPLLTSIIFFKSLNINNLIYKKTKVINFQFWKYGFFASLSNVVTQLLFVIDILLIGFILSNTEMVTNYRYVSIIPFSMLFLPRVFIATDFVAFTEKIYDAQYIFKYIKSYVLFFTVVSILVLLFSWLFSVEILGLLDKEFTQFSDTFIILMIGICGIFILRGLFGNLLSSIGKAHLNYYIATLALVINICANFYLIPKYGIKGAAITSAILMWFTGLLSYLLFIKLYKKLLLKKG